MSIKLGSYRDENLFINSSFDFWQRGVGPFTTPSAVIYTADRFEWQMSSAGAWDAQIDKETTSTIDGKPVNSLKVTTTGNSTPSGSDFAFIGYKIEGYDWSRVIGEEITISFYVKSNVTGNYPLMLRAGSTGNLAYVTSYNIPDTGWNRVSVTIPGNVAAIWQDLENGVGIEVMWSLAAGASRIDDTLDTWYTQTNTVVGFTGQADFFTSGTNTFEITQVQLNRGSKPAPFRRAGSTIQDELAMCQRYYEKTYNLGTSPGTITDIGRRQLPARVLNSTTLYSHSDTFKVPKRTTPSVALYDTDTLNTSGKVQVYGVNSGSSSQENGSTSAVSVTGFLVRPTGLTGMVLSETRIFFYHFVAAAEL